MRLTKALLAATTIAMLAIAPPILLVLFVGSPIPADVAATAGLSDGDLIKLLSLALWLLWAQTVWCVAVEMVAAARSTNLNRTPGTFAIQQHFAQVMVGAVIAASVTTPILSSGTADAAESSSAPSDVAAVAADPPQGLGDRPETPSPAADAPDLGRGTVEVRVDRGDSLWSIAEARLGDGERWADIAALNEGQVMNDGRVFRASEVLQPGWQLEVPADHSDDSPSAPMTHRSGDYIVQRGDTLSAIALEHTGDAGNWPDLFERSVQMAQSVPLKDPNLIYPGQRIDLAEPAPEARPEAGGKRPAELNGELEEPVQGHFMSPRAVEGDEPVLRDQVEKVTIDHGAISSDDGGSGDRLPTWAISGLLGGGGLLAGSLFLSLRRRRAFQHRNRRPGRVVRGAGPELMDVEKTISVMGRENVPLVELLDGLLKRTASVLIKAGCSLPSVAAVEVSSTVLALHLRNPGPDVPAPWIATDDGLVWIFERNADLNEVGPEEGDAPAPWPLLVTVGEDDCGNTWLINIEDQSVAVTGDAVAVRDFARFVAAEIVCNPWSSLAKLDLLGVAEEIVDMRPDRIQVHGSASTAVGEVLEDAARNIDRLEPYDADTPVARAQQIDPDSWLPRLLMLDGHKHPGTIDQLADLLSKHAGRTGAGVLLVDGHVDGGIEIHIDESRRMTIPAVNLDVTAVGLSAAEAEGCAALLARADEPTDQKAPNCPGDQAWKQMATTTGSLRDEFRLSRADAEANLAASVLSATDETYVDTGATISEDLKRLAPIVNDATRTRATEADPTLDRDVADWFADSCSRPRLTLLGPVGARTRGRALDRRKPYYAELFAYLATRPYGATTDEVATAFDITPARVRIDINKLRDWLGADPVTGEKFLPDARLAPSAQQRGVGVYEVVNPLVDVDLFRRLRVRGESRGSVGVKDLRRALELVAGRPFQQLRTGGWNWLFEGDRLDIHMTCAIVDVAHVVVTHSLQVGDLEAAHSAASLAANTAPDEEIPLLDLAAVLDAQGHAAEAEQLVRDHVSDRDDDGDAPVELTARAERIIDSHHWLRRNAG